MRIFYEGWSMLERPNSSVATDEFTENNNNSAVATAEFRSSIDVIQQTASAKSENQGLVMPVQLSWSHYERLIRVADPEARLWYLNEAASHKPGGTSALTKAGNGR